MAALPSTTIQHFTHPNHPLQIHEDKQYYKCDGCKIIGSGKRYRCHSCDFDLHEHCATCPTTFSSFMHPQHPLNLVVRESQATRQNERVCDVCGDHVEGLFYRCKLCEFDVHPLCTQLPQLLRHALHPAHPLTLQPSSASDCLVCKSACTSWRYRCETCCVDIHLECILEPCNETSQRSVLPPYQQPPPMQPGQPPFNGGYPNEMPSGFNSYNMYQYQNVQPGQPPFYGGYPNGMPTGFNPYNMYQYQNVQPGQPPFYGGYPNGMPSGFNPYNMYQYPYQNVNHLQPQRGGATNRGNTSKIMFDLVGTLAGGVLSHTVFGGLVDLFS